MNKRKFNQLLDDYLQGRLTNGEKSHVEQWLHEQEPVDDSNITWTEADKATLLDKINLQLDALEYKERKMIRLKVWISVVIIVLILLTASLISWKIYSTKSTQLPASEVKEG